MRAEQGVWHQWQRQPGEVAAEDDALPVVMVLHGWAGGAGTAAAATGEGTAASTASEAGVGEP